MIREKLKGHKPIHAAAPERGNVINLMDALKAEPRPGQASGPEQAQGRAGRQGAGQAPLPSGRPQEGLSVVEGATFGIWARSRLSRAALPRGR